MNCPQCKLELRITNSATVVEDNKAYTVQTFSCVNPQCQYGSMNIPVKQIKHEHNEKIADLSEYVTCHGNVLAKDDFVPDNIEKKVLGEAVFVVCPDCQKSYRLSDRKV